MAEQPLNLSPVDPRPDLSTLEKVHADNTEANQYDGLTDGVAPPDEVVSQAATAAHGLVDPETVLAGPRASLAAAREADNAPKPVPKPNLDRARAKNQNELQDTNV